MSNNTNNISYDNVSRDTKLQGAANYQTWSIFITLFLRKQKLHKWIDPNWQQLNNLKVEGEVDTKVGLESLSEDAINSMEITKLELLQSMIAEHHHLVHRSKTAYDAWVAIQEAFQPTGFSAEYQVISRMENLQWGESTSIGDASKNLLDFLNEESRIQADATAIGISFVKLTEEQLLRYNIMRILNKLPPELFSTFVDHTTNKIDTYVSFQQFKTDLRNWGSTRFVTSLANPIALAAKVGRKSREKCEICQYTGHSKKTCYFDEKNAHLRPPGWEDRRKTRGAAVAETSQPHDLFANTVILTPVTSRDTLSQSKVINLPNHGSSGFQSNLAAAGPATFLLDSGASNHMTNLKEFIINPQACRVSVTFADNSVGYTEGVGEMLIECEANGRMNLVHLREVYYGTWCKNLISVGFLAEKGGFVGTISKSIMTLSKLNKPAIQGVSQGNGLYYIKGGKAMDPDMYPKYKERISALQKANNAVAASVENSVADDVKAAKLAHLRLQHPSYGVMLAMVKNGTLKVSVPGLLSAKRSIENCTSCAIGKAHAKPFPKSPSGHARSTTRPLELIHSDLMTGLPGNMPNIMTIIDDFTGYVWSWNMRRKSDALQCFKTWFALMKTQYPAMTVKTLRTDNGGEFVNDEFKEFCAKHGIVHQLTVPYTPQQNGVAERMNRTIADKVVCSLHDAHLPRIWWFYAIGAAIYTINRSLNSRNLIPWESLNGKKASLEGLHPFGCRAIAKQESATKFSPRAKECIMLGYETNTKGYRLYDIENKRFLTSRNVKFYDDIFPGIGEKSEKENEDITSLYKILRITPESETKTSNTPRIVEIPDAAEDAPTKAPAMPTNHQHSTEPAVDSPKISETSSNDETEESADSQTPSETLSNDEAEEYAFEDAVDEIDLLRQPNLQQSTKINPAPTSPAKVRRSTRKQSSRQLFCEIASDRKDIVPNEQDSFLAELFAEIPQLSAACLELNDLSENSSAPYEMDCFIAQAEGDFDWPKTMAPEEIPTTYSRAISSIHARYWQRAMDEHIATLKARGTFKLVKCPEKTKPIDGKWVYTVKVDSKNEVVAFKARWVVRGFQQKEGIDYQETFSPVCKATTVRLVQSVCTRFNWTMRQGDAVAAFLLAEMDGTVHVTQPTGYHIGEKDQVCLLIKALWGLRQSPLLFWKLVSKIANQLGFRQTDGDECLFATTYLGDIVLLVVYVDDFIITGQRKAVNHFFDKIAKEIEITDRGYVECNKISRLLGVSVQRGNDGSLHLSQEDYIIKMLAKYDPNNSLKASNTPMSSWETKKWSMPGNSCNRNQYLEAIGEIIYLSMTTRPDISFTAGRLAQHSSNPTEWHWQSVLRLIRYLKGTPTRHLVYRCNEKAPAIEMFADADFAGDKSTGKSTSGCLIKIYGNTVLWQSTKQRCVVTSTLEAEYIAYSRAAKNVLWLAGLIQACLPNEKVFQSPIPTWSDNMACIASLANEISRSTKLRHIDVSYRFVRDLIHKKYLEVSYIASALQPADIFTKSFESPALTRLVRLLGMADERTQI